MYKIKKKKKKKQLGIAGALGYADNIKSIRYDSKQATLAVGGSILSPVIGAGVKKIKGEKTELGPLCFKGDKKDVDVIVKVLLRKVI